MDEYRSVHSFVNKVAFYHTQEGSDTWKRFLSRHLFLQQDQFMHATAASRCIHEALPPDHISINIDMNSIHLRQLHDIYPHTSFLDVKFFNIKENHAHFSCKTTRTAPARR
jgi:hypothetical protein